MAEQEKCEAFELPPKDEPQENGAQPEPLPTWPEYIKAAPIYEVAKRFSSEIEEIISRHTDLQSEYCFLFMLNSAGRIGSFDLDQYLMPSLL